MKKAYFLIVFVVVLVGAVGWKVYKSDSSKTGELSGSSQSSNSTSASAFNKKKYSIDDPTSIWVVVNKSRPLKPIDYAPSDLTPVDSGQMMRQESAGALVKMFKDAAIQGIKLSALSGYRSYQMQVGVYNNEVKKNGQTVADSESAKPGHSEHQTGLAVDVGGGGCNIDDCFGKTKEGQWIAAHSYEYGFIVRYTADKQAITGYRAEPWHIRYIGTELSTELHKENVATLEEFFGL